MYRLKVRQCDDFMIYQWHKYNPETNELEICHDYNESVIINSVEYFPIDGRFSIPIDIMEDIPMTLCKMHCELNDMRQDIRTIYGILIKMKGWDGQ